MSAILFGSISTLADTSELQRSAFNQAFADHGLDWDWDRDTYLSMLESSGGQDRVAQYAASRGESVDAAAVHATKSEIFQRSLAGSGIAPRAGVVETIADAKGAGMKVGFVTTTSGANVDALLEALAPAVSADGFDVLVDTSDVTNPKPDPSAYTYALAELGEQPDTCVAIEDNLGGVGSASAAGIAVVAFPNANTAAHDFGAAAATVETLELDTLRALIGGDDQEPAA